MASKTIFLYGEVGWEVTAEDFATDTENLVKGDIANVRILSGGGDVFTGFGIYNLMKRSEATFNVFIDGMAGSIASVISMGANKVIVAEGAMMMIHKASLLNYGNADDLENSKEILKQIDSELVAVYAKKTGLPTEEIETLMSKDRYFTSKELLELGFADEYDDQPIKAVAYREILNTMKGANMSEKEKVKAEVEEPKVEEPKVEEPKAKTEAEIEAEFEAEVQKRLDAKLELQSAIDNSMLHPAQAELIQGLKAEAGMTLGEANTRINADFKANRASYSEVSVKDALRNEAPKAVIPEAEVVKEKSHMENWKELLASNKTVEATEYFNKNIKPKEG